MKFIMNLRGVQTTSRRQLRNSFQWRLSDRCQALCQENTQLKAKLAQEKNNSVSLKRLTVQLCQESGEARDWVAQDKLLQEKLDRINNEISQSQEDFKAELCAEKEKKRLLREKLQKKCLLHQATSQSYETDAINAISEVHKLQRELENSVQQHEGLRKDYEELCVANALSQKNFTTELHAERQKNLALQEELQRTCVSYNQISHRYATDVNNARHELDNILRELQYGIQQHQDLQKVYEELCVAHTFSQTNFTAELHAERQKNIVLQEELQRTCSLSHEMKGGSQRDEVDVVPDTFQLQRELERKVKTHADTVSEAWRVINNLRAECDVLLQKTSCLSPNKKAQHGTNHRTLDTDVDMEWESYGETSHTATSKVEGAN